MATKEELQAALAENNAQRQTLAAKIGPATDAAQQAYDSWQFFLNSSGRRSPSWTGTVDGVEYTNYEDFIAANKAKFDNLAEARRNLAVQFNELFPIKDQLEADLAALAEEAAATNTAEPPTEDTATETPPADATASEDGASRDIGNPNNTGDTRPDGGPTLTSSDGVTVAQNTASVTTGTATPGATVNPNATTTPNPTSTGGLNLGGLSTANPNGPPFPNPLERFASVTYLWSLACLTPKQFNDPKSYRNNPSVWLNDSYTDSQGKQTKSSIVFASAGRFDGNRAPTFAGSPEYFVDNFNMNTVIAATQKTGNSNAVSFSFDIFEPYSMGLLLHSMQTSAINAGWPSYLDNAPYLLKLEYVGYTDDGKMFGSTEKLSRYWTVKLKKVKFSVTEAGSNYKVECIPYNHQGFSKSLNTTFSDIAITGDTLNELLASGPKSLRAVLNEREKSNAGKEGGLPNIYDIVFPTDESDDIGLTPSDATTLNRALVMPNFISELLIGSKSKDEATTDFGGGVIGNTRNTMGFNQASGGDYVTKLDGDVKDEKTGIVNRNKMTIDPKIREFKFSQDQSLTEIITQCVLSSDYAKNAIDPSKLDAEGQISWFRIDTQIQLLEFDIKRNDYAKRIIYRILPFKVHSSIFTNPTSAPSGYQQLKKIIAKQYNYIYTGLNNDVLKFDIDIDNMFYTGKPPAPPEQTSQNQNQDGQSAASEKRSQADLQQGSAPDGIANTTGSKPVKPDMEAGLPPSTGGSGSKTTEQRVADAFQNAFLKNSADLINLNLEILGDPYWLVDSGIGNYLAPLGPNSQTNADLTMNYEGSDTYVYVTFRTPVEPNLGVVGTGGLWNFPPGEIVSPFSGIYKVVKCDNKFAGGVFTQTLKLIRMTGQPQDYEGKQTISKAQSTLYKLSAAPTLKTFIDADTASKSTKAAEGYNGPNGESVGS